MDNLIVSNSLIKVCLSWLQNPKQNNDNLVKILFIIFLYDLYKNYTKLIKNSNPIYMEKYLMMN